MKEFRLNLLAFSLLLLDPKYLTQNLLLDSTEINNSSSNKLNKKQMINSLHVKVHIKVNDWYQILII